MRGGRSPWGSEHEAVIHSRTVTQPLIRAATAGGYGVAALPMAAPAIFEAGGVAAAGGSFATKGFIAAQSSAWIRAAIGLLGAYHIYNFATDSNYRGATISIDGGTGFSSVGFAASDLFSSGRQLLQKGISMFGSVQPVNLAVFSAEFQGGPGARWVGEDLSTSTSYEAWIDRTIAQKGALYQERSPEEVAALRREFENVERPAYLRWYAEQEEATDFSSEQVERMRKGLLPEDWVIHHMKPLFRMGTNDWGNFLLTTKQMHIENFDAWHFYDFNHNPFFDVGAAASDLAH